MYEESVSHCPINVTWFPFDDQHCYLIFESWKYNSNQLNTTSAATVDNVQHFLENEQWQLLGTYIKDWENCYYKYDDIVSAT